MNNQSIEKECCPRFDPSPWNNRILEWNNKRFIKDKVFTFFYIPINFGSIMQRMVGKIEKSGAKLLDSMVLSDHTSKWNMNIYIAVDKEVEDAENVALSGKFLTRVYEGNFNETEKWCNDFKAYAKEKNFEIRKWYMWYTTCPKCAKKYGKNYVLILAEI